MNIARRLILGIPIHLDEKEHDYREDGYCNCGAKNPEIAEANAKRRVRHVTESVPLPRPRSNLDVIEENWEEYRGGIR